MKIDSGSYRAFIGKDSNNIIKVKSFYINDIIKNSFEVNNEINNA